MNPFNFTTISSSSQNYSSFIETFNFPEFQKYPKLANSFIKADRFKSHGLILFEKLWAAEPPTTK